MTDTNITLAAATAGLGGPQTITASAPLFASADVGRLLAIFLPAPARAASTAYNVGDVRYSDYNSVDRVYRCVSAGTTAAANLAGTTPNYDQNAPRDAGVNVPDGSVVWKYLGAGQKAWGFGVITAVADSQHVTVNVDPRGPMPAAGASLRWKLGEWSLARGYPRTVTFYQQRSVWGGSISKPQTLWFSESGDFYSMSGNEPDGTVLDTNAITIAIDDDQANVIRWLSGLPRGLAVGVPSGEFLVGPASATNAALAPSNVRASRQGDRGSAAIAAERVSGVALFAQKGAQKIRQLEYDFATDTFTTQDLSQLSDHIAGAGFVEIAYQEVRDGTLWAVRTDGVLVTLTFDREQKVRAWARHILGGADVFVESVCVVPSPDGTTEDVYLSVTRTIGGQTVGTIEYLQQPFRGELDGVNGGYFVDCGLTYSGPPAWTFSGLNHLEGQTVQICADGSVRNDQVVVGGSVTINGPKASLVHIGLYAEAVLTTLRPEVQVAGSTTQGLFAQITETIVRLYETRGGRIGRRNDDGTVDIDEAFQLRDRATPYSQAYPLFSDDYVCQFPGGVDRRGQMTISADQPLPMTILAVIRNVSFNG